MKPDLEQPQHQCCNEPRSLFGFGECKNSIASAGKDLRVIRVVATKTDHDSNYASAFHPGTALALKTTAPAHLVTGIAP